MAVDTGILDQVTQQFINAFQHDSGIIATAAKNLFYNLCVIQLTVSALWMALSGEGLQKMFLNLLRLSLIFSIFYSCILNGGQWIPDVINGFIQLGQKSGVTSVDPGSILSQGLSIAGGILKAYFNWGVFTHPFVNLIGDVVVITLVIIYALIAAELVIVLAKSYFLVSISSLFFSFAACDLTRPMTVNYLKTVVGIGLQLMTLYFLVGVGQYLGSNWAATTAQAAQQHLIMPMLVILASVIVYYMIVKNLPTFVAGLSGVGGFRNYGAEAAVMAINAGMTGAGKVAKAAGVTGGAVQAIGQAAQAVGVAGNAAGVAAGGMSFMKGYAKFTSTGASHFASAGYQATKDAIMKRNSHQSFGQKFNQHLANRVKQQG